MLFAKLAWRNVLRNPRRTALTIAVVVIGVASLVFTWALFDGSNNQSISTMTGTFTGHVQIHAQGYTDDPSLDRTFQSENIDFKRLRGVDGVLAATPRLQAPVMISTGETSRGVLLVGVDPEQEKTVTTLNTKLSHGNWFARDGSKEIIVGSSLAKALNVQVGSDVSVLTQGFEGSIGAARYRVKAIYNTGNEMVDGMQAFISLSDAKNLLSAQGQLTSVAFKLADYGKSDLAVAQISQLLNPSYEVEGWAKLLPDVAQKVSFHEWIASIVMVILFGIVMVGVTNTVTMSALERTREFGVVMALGTAPSRIFWMILLEGALLGMVGFTVGLLIGGALVAHFGANGIDFSSMSTAVQQLPGMSNKLYPHLSLARMLFLASILMLVTIAAAIYPAWRTASLVPLNAIRGFASSSSSGGFGSSTPSSLPIVPLLALRNIGRHPMRAMLTGFSIMFAMATFVFLGCFVVGYYKQLVENSTGFLTGDGQIQQRDFRATLEPNLTVSDGDKLVDQIRKLDNVRSASARVQTPAMVSSAKSAEPVQLLGVMPTDEKSVTFLYKSIRKGRYLESNAAHEVVIGRKLAERLRVEVGERVVVTAQDIHGALSAEAFVVVGLFDTGSHGFDETMAQIPLPLLQKMLDLGTRHSSIAFRVTDMDRLSQTVSAVQALVKQPDAKVYTWSELVPEVVQMNAMFKGSLLLVMSVVFVTIAVVIMNTILMTVLERTREFGTMLSLGSPPNLIVRLVVLEALVVGGVGSMLGLGFGSLAAWAHSLTGMSMKAHGLAAIPGTTDVVFPQLTMGATLQPAVLMMGMILLVSLYPAWRASKLEPVEALRAV